MKKIRMIMVLSLFSWGVISSLQLEATCNITGSDGYCNVVIGEDAEGNPISLSLECESETTTEDPEAIQRCKMENEN